MIPLSVAVSSVSFSKSLVLRELALASFSDVYFNTSGRILQGEELAAFIGNSEAAIVGTERIDAAVLSGLSTLKAVSKYGVGLDNINFSDCRSSGVSVLHRPGVNSDAVAEMTIALAIAAQRNIVKSAAALKNGEWLKNGGSTFSGKTIGIIGLGHIGSKVAALGKAFGCTILANDICDKAEIASEMGIRLVEKDEIYAAADIVTLHVPLTEKTHYLINEGVLEKMKSTSILINTARGRIVHQKSLKKALKTHSIAGAALDVYEVEPLIDEELYSLENCICTAHIAGNATEAVEAMGRAAVEELVQWTKKNYKKQ